jgi:plasmid stabilization system protein ParE
MTLDVAFHDDAAGEYVAALEWYEQRGPALADALRDGVRSALERILAGPEDFPFARNDIRTVPVKRFPYTVLYRVERNRILVVAVFHAKRNPRIWQSRI